MHVLPRGFVRIRRFGWPANRCRRRLAALRRSLLQPELAQTGLPPAGSPPASLRQCPHCGGAVRVEEGCVGAGTGATLGKVFGMKQAMKSGVGSFTVTLSGGVLVCALVAVNAFGDVREPASGRIIAGARKTPESREFADSDAQMKRGGSTFERGSHTTLAVVATNARLTKVQAAKLAQLGSLGTARAIYPVNTMFDGDIAFALSIGDKTADINALGSAAAEAVTQAILRAVKLARTLGGKPGLG
jgi:L-aminopeptidase/D-esterase-like protein